MSSKYDWYDSSANHDVSPRHPTTLRLVGLEPITFISIILIIIFFIQLKLIFLAPFFRLLLAPIGGLAGVGATGGFGGVGGGFGGAGGGFGGGFPGGGINGFLGIGNTFGLPGGLLNTGLLGPAGLFGTGLLNSGILTGLGLGSGLGTGGMGTGTGLGGGTGGVGAPARLSREGSLRNNTTRESKNIKFEEVEEIKTNSVTMKRIEPHYCHNDAVCYTIRSSRIT